MFTSPKSQMGKKTKDQQMSQQNKRQATTDGIREISSLRNVLKAYNIFYILSGTWVSISYSLKS